MSIRTVNMKEWDSVFLDRYELPDKNAQEIAKILNDNGIIEIIEVKNGLSIKTNSHIGRIKIGNLQINISPKIEGLPLYQLLRYAYGFRDIKFISNAEYSIDEFSFFDLLILELYIEVKNLLLKGISRNYVPQEGKLQNPKGRIDFAKLCKDGGIIEAKLPCQYFNRTENHILNQVLLSGLRLSLNLLMDEDLRIRIIRLIELLSESVDNIVLSRNTIALAINNINRLTKRYAKAIHIINILYESHGIELEDGLSRFYLQGYCFDMNAFFETLIYRLLIDHCEGYMIKSQHNMYNMFTYTPGYNPKRHKSPTPRPDYAVIKDGQVIKLLDAKYRDLWELNLPSNMLYQLAIYALSGIGDNTATILYPTLNDGAVIQKLDIKDPIRNTKKAQVILQPVNLNMVAKLITSENGAKRMASLVQKWLEP